MHLMDPDKKVKQPRLIGESLADAKLGMYVRTGGAVQRSPRTPSNDHLPPWAELTPREQAAFVRVWDDYNFGDNKGAPEHVAAGKIAGKAYEAQEGHRQRKADEAKRKAARDAELSKEDFQKKAREKAAAEEKAEFDRIAKESAEKKAADKAKRAEKKPAPKKKEKDGKIVRPPTPEWVAPAQALVVQHLSKEITKTEMVEGFQKLGLTLEQVKRAVGDQLDNWGTRDETAYAAALKEQANGNQRESTQAEGVGEQAEVPASTGRVGGQDGQEVQRSGPATVAGEKVPEGGAGRAADATAAEAHGPGSVRSADGEAAAGGSAEGNAGDVSTSDVMLAPKVRAAMEEGASEEPIEHGVQLDSGKWVTLEQRL